MSATDNDLYRVLYTDADGDEQLTDAMTYNQAHSRAKDLQRQRYEVGAIMGDIAAQGYMHARYGTEYRGVRIPDGLRDDGQPRALFEAWKRGVDSMLSEAKSIPADDPFARDLTMSTEAADYILRALTGLLKNGYRPKAYTGYGPDDADKRGFDAALILRAAGIVGRENIRNRELLRHLAELDEEAD